MQREIVDNNFVKKWRLPTNPNIIFDGTSSGRKIHFWTAFCEKRKVLVRFELSFISKFSLYSLSLSLPPSSLPLFRLRQSQSK